MTGENDALGGTFWRMYLATASSDLADGIGRTALPLAAAAFTRDPVTISGLTSFTFLPWLLFALPSGALIDRVDRRKAMAAANAVRALAVGALTIVVLADEGSVAVLYAVAFLLGAAETVYDSAVRALLPQVVGAHQLDRANSLITVEEELGQTFVGAPLGSVLFAVAVSLPFLLNAAGFLLAVVLILTVRGHYRPARAAEVTTIRTDIGEGVRWLRRHALLRGLTLISAGTAFANTIASGVLVLYVLEVLRLPAGDFGLFLLVGGAGALAGSIATPPLARRVGRAVMLTAGSLVAATAIGLMAVTRNGYIAAALFAVAAGGVMVWNVLTMSLRQALIPSALFGRVQGAYRTLVWGGIPLGSLTGGLLAGGLGIRWAFLIAGAIMLVLAVLLGRLLRKHPDELADHRPSELAAVR
ncbi:MAG: MFS transporter [Jatrophihabitans sp.]|uniref:MFS transporter n=1 Tax=Jatrophihabitans sp. TaxID=1932789 RepID=UPI00391031E9